MSEGNATARCAAHGAPAQDACVRCGDYVCVDCRVWRRERPHCKACLGRLGTRPSRRARLALLLTTFGVCGGVPALVGGVLAIVELRAIAKGSAPPEGEGMAVTARNLALFYLIIVLPAIARHLLS